MRLPASSKPITLHTTQTRVRTRRCATLVGLFGALFLLGSILQAEPQKTKSSTETEQCDARFAEIYASCLKATPRRSDAECRKAAVAGWKTCRKAAGRPVAAAEQPPSFRPNLTPDGVATAQTAAPGTRVGIKAPTAPTSLRVAVPKATPSPTPRKRPTAPLPAPQTGTFIR